MFSFLKRRPKPAVKSTPLSEFVRVKSSAEKKRIYEAALKRASDAQNKVVEHAERRKATAGA